jgi:uncharacterized protein
MDARFSSHNLHLQSLSDFERLDPHLMALKQSSLVWLPKLLAELPIQPGVYTITGGRQVGKTTLLKQWMQRLLHLGVDPYCLCFFTGELIDDHHSLVHILQNQLEAMPKDQLKFILLDEVTYIDDWDKGVKFLADAGQLGNTALTITGSDSVVIQEARARFPGRRGSADKADFRLYPLSFSEVVELKKTLRPEERKSAIEAVSSLRVVDLDPPLVTKLTLAWNEYLIHGGFLSAINDYANNKQISAATLTTYSDWIRGDFIRHGKQELYLREIVQAIIKRYGSQISWHSLSKDLSIDHHKTVSDYIELLEKIDAAFALSALREEALSPAPKKPKKVFFSDPFIYHALHAWISPISKPYTEQIRPLLQDADTVSLLSEGVVSSLYRRRFETYYIKAEGEVDVAYIHQKKFWPVEVKWTSQIRPTDLKQIRKYSNGIILGKTNKISKIDQLLLYPLPVYALSL